MTEGMYDPRKLAGLAVAWDSKRQKFVGIDFPHDTYHKIITAL